MQDIVGSADAAAIAGAAETGVGLARLGTRVAGLVDFSGVAEAASEGLGEGAADASERLAPRFARPQGPVVIGEGMQDRVIPFAETNGYDWYRGARSMTDSEYMTHNQGWIRSQQALGRPIIDVGADPRRINYPNPTSRYYAMELREVSDYSEVLRVLLDEPDLLQVGGGNYH